VLRCGGGKALTKQASDENPLKFHVAVEEMNKVGDADAIVVCSAQVSSGLEEKVKVVPVKNEMKSERNRLGKIVLELYDLEDCVESEKPVKIDLDVDLYQMEKV
jgi:galactitol-specific phosphotransferase system IIB component